MFDPDQPRDEIGRWASFDAREGLQRAASDKNVGKILDDAITETQIKLDKIGMSDDYIYMDYEGINNGTPTSLLKSTSELKNKFGRPISTEVLLGKIQKMPSDIKEFISDNGKLSMDKMFKSKEVVKVKISDIIPVQKFVFEKAVKNANTEKALEVIKNKDGYVVVDGNHSLAKSFIIGKIHVNAKIIDISK